MSRRSDTARDITREASTCDTVEVLQPAKVGEGLWRNELLFFTKPEIFLVPETDQSEKSIDLILEKMRAFDASVEGIAVVGGRVLEEMEIMSKHYGFINTLSTSASKVLTADDRRKIEDALSISVSGFEILGGHEYLEQYPGVTS